MELRNKLPNGETAMSSTEMLQQYCTYCSIKIDPLLALLYLEYDVHWRDIVCILDTFLSSWNRFMNKKTG